MARIARVVVPGIPHHLTQRGNRRQVTFFGDDDYRLYRALMAEWCASCGVAVWAYCLMPNHTHLIVAPDSERGLRQAIGEAHRRYTRHVNFREGWRGHLWQGRFGSFPMDESYLLVAARYVELNPVKAGLAATPEVYPWRSAAAHLSGKDDALVTVAPLLHMMENGRQFLSDGIAAKDAAVIERHIQTGRPLGNTHFLENIEQMLGRVLKYRKPGPKPKLTHPGIQYGVP